MNPLQYQKGYAEFYKLKFKVTKDVLIPRPETELLVDEAIAIAKEHLKQGVHVLILDIGTGSGNIAISIGKNLLSFLQKGHLKIIASDVSSEALIIAKLNAKLQLIQNHIEFIKSDLLENYPLHLKSFDNLENSKIIIVANLPYIPAGRIPSLDSSVKDFEPILALSGGEDGFELYRKLFQSIQSKQSKFPHLSIIGEIDVSQSKKVLKEATHYFPQANIQIKKDLTRRDRYFVVWF